MAKLNLEGIAAGRRAWDEAPPGRLLGPGHQIGDMLDAPAWEVLEQGEGRLVVLATLPERMQNYRGQLFGGFTGTYVDFIALGCVRQQLGAGQKQLFGLTTLNMHIDYYEPVTGPSFRLGAEIVKARGRNYFLDVRFATEGGDLCAAAGVALRQVELAGNPAVPAEDS